MARRLKQILAAGAVTLLTLGAEAHEPEGPLDGDQIVKLCKEAWSWIAGACGTAGGYIAEHDLAFWLGVLVLVLTAADRSYEILIKCRRYRSMGAED